MNFSFLIDVMRNTFNVIKGFFEWLNEPLILGYSPFAILFGFGLFVIIGLHVFKLLNPLS